MSEPVSTDSAVAEAPTRTCPSCGAPSDAGQLFCESCGAALAGTAPAGDPAPVPARHDGTLLDDVTAAATDMARRSGVTVVDADLDARPTTCASCQGAIADDGYCTQCGAPARTPRDHWRDQPAPWVVAVCDRGIRHTRNEDAAAVAAAQTPGSFAAIVVCDGVSSATDSDIASLSAARAARDVLIDGIVVPAPGQPAPAITTTGRTARAAELVTRVIASAAAAQERAAASAAAVAAGQNPPSCTFVAAIAERLAGAAQGVLVVGWVGDSRAYWFPDDGPAVQLSVDDSWATEAIEQGASREDAEKMPQAHAITRWLGVDAPDAVPRTVVQALAEPGWVLVCSDGLWNYCSEATALAALIAETLAGGADRDPATLAEALVAWANAQGGQDNVTVALARVDLAPPA